MAYLFLVRCIRALAEAQMSLTAISSLVATVVGVLALVVVWWTRRADAIKSVATQYVDLLRRHPHPNAIKFLQDSGILTLRSRWQVSAAFQRIYELSGHELSAHLPSCFTPANIIVAIRAARKHGCDLSTAAGIYKLLTSEWSPLQIRDEIDDQMTNEPNT
jgi:hypothetical protein